MNNEEIPLQVPRTIPGRKSESSQIAFPATAVTRVLNSQNDEGTRTPPTKSNLSALLDKDTSSDGVDSKQQDGVLTEPKQFLRKMEQLEPVVTNREVASPRRYKHPQQHGRLGRSVPSSVPSSTSGWRQAGQAHVDSFRQLKRSRRRQLSTPTGSLTNVVSPKTDHVRRYVESANYVYCCCCSHL